MNLSPQQELELIKYIEGLSTIRLSPTRAKIRNFRTFIAKKSPVQNARFPISLNRNSNNLTITSSKGIDRNRYVANSREAKARDAVRQQEKDEKKLRKADDKKLKKAALLHKRQQQKAAKELRESAAAARKKDPGAKNSFFTWLRSLIFVIV
jgi:hypothetical protein